MLSEYATGSSLLEVGCGIGNDIQGLTSLGFDYLGIEWSRTAADLANNRAEVMCIPFDELNESHRFNVVYEKGFFHGLPGQSSRERFCEKLTNHLMPGGLWLTVAGTGDHVTFNRGAILMTDLVYPAERWFEVLEVRRAQYGVVDPALDFEAWYAAFRRR